ncbi:MAG: helix-turn-helix transcriptional regulator [Magnetovibrio sp.]|nr:helix-turn-helix transcriptional regulator [Magnetovibrio sp.]
MLLKIYIEENGCTEAELARCIGVSQAAISRYKSGQRLPRPDIVAKIEAVTGGDVTPSDHQRAFLLRVSEENSA